MESDLRFISGIEFRKKQRRRFVILFSVLIYYLIFATGITITIRFLLKTWIAFFISSIPIIYIIIIKLKKEFFETIEEIKLSPEKVDFKTYNIGRIFKSKEYAIEKNKIEIEVANINNDNVMQFYFKILDKSITLNFISNDKDYQEIITYFKKER